MVRFKNKFRFVATAVDTVIFSVRESKFSVLLMKMKKSPYEGFWAAPGGLVKPRESVNDAAERILKERVGTADVYFEQLYTFGKVGRDPRGRVVSTAYFALMPGDNRIFRIAKEHGDTKWFPVNKLPKLAYDHAEIIDTAVKRLRAKLGYTNIVCGLMPKTFTLSELQRVYEAILEKKLDKRNFRKKIFSKNLVKKAGGVIRSEANRPAQLYIFSGKKVTLI